MRVSDDLGAALDTLAAERKQSVSQLVRELLVEAVGRSEAVASLDARGLVDRLVADVEEVSRRLAG